MRFWKELRRPSPQIRRSVSRSPLDSVSLVIRDTRGVRGGGEFSYSAKAVYMSRCSDGATFLGSKMFNLCFVT